MKLLAAVSFVALGLSTGAAFAECNYSKMTMAKAPVAEPMTVAQIDRPVVAPTTTTTPAQPATTVVTE